MAVVYRTWDTRLRVWRAVKVLLPEAAARKQLRERFEAEAQTMARLRHRNILAVHDVGIGVERPYMVMDLVRGGSLVDWVGKHGPMPPRMAARVMGEVLAGLHFAHENGVVHRDVKPHNVLVEVDGTPLVADFGIARIEDTTGSSSKTRTGVTMGTLAYMAPEQRTSARRVDARADVYAAAGTLLALLTGQEPYDLYVPKELDRQLAGVPASMAAIVRKAGAYDPDDRYASAAAMAEALAAPTDLPEIPADTPPLGLAGAKTLPPPPAPEDDAAAVVAPASATFMGDLGGVTVDTLAGPNPPHSDPGLRPVAVTAPTSISAPPPDSPVSTPSRSMSTEGTSVVKAGFFAGVGIGVVALAALLVLGTVGAIGAVAYTASGSGTTTADAATAIPATAPAPPTAPAAPAPAATAAATAPAAAPPAVEPSPAAAPAEPAKVVTKTSTKATTKTSTDAAKADAAKADAAKTDAPPAPPPAKGTLKVNAMPPGTVSVDGFVVGTTPWQGEVDAGRHAVTIDGESGRQSIDVTVGPGAMEKLCWDFTTNARCARR